MFWSIMVWAWLHWFWKTSCRIWPSAAAPRGLLWSYGPPAQTVSSLSWSRSVSTLPNTMAPRRPLPIGSARSQSVPALSSYHRARSSAALTSEGGAEAGRAAAVHPVGSMAAPAPAAPNLKTCLRERSDISHPSGGVNRSPPRGQARRGPWRRLPSAGPPERASGPGDQVRVHFWLAAPVQVQICTRVPLAVPAPWTSRHLFAPTAVMLPSAFSVHFWLSWPLQSQMMTAVPSAVPAPLTSRHLLPYTRSSPAAVEVHCWFAPP